MKTQFSLFKHDELISIIKALLTIINIFLITIRNIGSRRLDKPKFNNELCPLRLYFSGLLFKEEHIVFLELPIGSLLIEETAYVCSTVINISSLLSDVCNMGQEAICVRSESVIAKVA